MTPEACRASAVSWIEAIKGLRYCFLIAVPLHERSLGDGVGGEFPERGQFILARVVQPSAIHAFSAKRVNALAPNVCSRARRESEKHSFQSHYSTAGDRRDGRRAASGG